MVRSRTVELLRDARAPNWLTIFPGRHLVIIRTSSHIVHSKYYRITIFNTGEVWLWTHVNTEPLKRDARYLRGIEIVE